MGYEIEIREVSARTLAVVRDRVTLAELGPKIMPALSEVYAFLQRRPDVRKTGHNAIVYGAGDITVPPGVAVEIGVEVTGTIGPDDRIRAAVTPACRAAYTLHRGPYDRIPAAHTELRTWCKAHNHAITDLKWEIYGDWRDDPAELETEIFYQLLP